MFQNELELIRVDRKGIVPVSENETEQEKTSATELYHEAFRNAGLDFAKVSRQEAVDWIKESPIHETLVASLDDWIRSIDSMNDPAVLSPLSDIWTVLKPMELRSAGATLEEQPDNSILAGATTGPEDNLYTFVARPMRRTITALRLEMLEDTSLPSNGPGWYWGTRALLAYRRGEAEQVIRFVELSEKHAPYDAAHAMNQVLFALAHHDLQHPEDAQSALRKAASPIADLAATTEKKVIQDWQIAEILYREAAAKINGGNNPDPQQQAEHTSPPSGSNSLPNPTQADTDSASGQDN